MTPLAYTDLLEYTNCSQYMHYPHCVSKYPRWPLDIDDSRSNELSPLHLWTSSSMVIESEGETASKIPIDVAAVINATALAFMLSVSFRV